MKKLGFILLLIVLPTHALAWAGYDYMPLAAEEQETVQQEIAIYDPAMVPLDLTEVSESEADMASTNMPLDAD